MAALGEDAAVTDAHRAAMLSARPDLEGVPLTLHANGWDCLAIAAGRVLFKFPHHPNAADRLRREPRTINLIRPVTPLALPTMRLHEAPMLMSEHEMVVGDPVDPERYRAMAAPERDRLAQDLAAFFAAVHSISPEEARRRDCDAVRPWAPTAQLLKRLDGGVPLDVIRVAETVLAKYDAHNANGGDELVFGQFDTHGWNMAYDNAAGRLHGLFDFAGSGVGALHRDLSYLMFVSPDLTRRVVERYRRETGRAVNLERVFDAHGALRVIELADEMGGGRPLDQFVSALLRFAQERPRF